MKGRVLLAPLVETPKRDNLDILEMQPLQQCSWLVAGVIGFLVGFGYHAPDLVKSDQTVEAQNSIGDYIKEKIGAAVGEFITNNMSERVKQEILSTTEAAICEKLAEPEFMNSLGYKPVVLDPALFKGDEV